MLTSYAQNDQNQPLTQHPRKRKTPKAMKTSIIVSNLAALCLVVLFTDVSNFNWIKETKSTSLNEISLLPAQVTTLATSTEPVRNLPVINRKIVNDQVPENDSYNYLKFDVACNSKTGSVDGEVIAELPVSSDNELEYLKFNVNEYISLEDQSDVYKELPEKDENTNNAPSSVNIINTISTEFEYLKFDVNNFITNDRSADIEIGELPMKEAIDMSTENTSPSALTENEINRLKFYVNRYYKENEPGYNKIDELPVPDESLTNMK